MGDMTNAYRILVESLNGSRPIRRPRYKWEDIKVDPRETGLEDVD
jgi:hypothetical protein